MIIVTCLIALCLNNLALISASLPVDLEANLDNLGQVIGDLSWLHTLPNNSLQAILDSQKLDVQQTSNVGSYLPGIETGADPVVPISGHKMLTSSNGDLMLVENQLAAPIPGRRRLDDDELVLSASRNTGNRQYSNQNDFIHVQRSTRAHSRSQPMFKVSERRASSRQRADQDSKLNKRVGGSDRRVDVRNRAKLSPTNRRKVASESRKKLTRPVPSYRSQTRAKPVDADDKSNADPFFNDEEVDRRTDSESEADDDDGSETADDEPTDQPTARKLRSFKPRLENSRRAAGDEKSSLDYGEDDVDASNLNPSKATNPAEPRLATGEQSVQSSHDLATAAGNHHGHSHGHYYQHVEVPKKGAWKFGFKRGNHKHESKFQPPPRLAFLQTISRVRN